LKKITELYKKASVETGSFMEAPLIAGGVREEII